MSATTARLTAERGPGLALAAVGLGLFAIACGIGVAIGELQALTVSLTLLGCVAVLADYRVGVVLLGEQGEGLLLGQQIAARDLELRLEQASQTVGRQGRVERQLAQRPAHGACENPPGPRQVLPKHHPLAHPHGDGEENTCRNHGHKPQVVSK